MSHVVSIDTKITDLDALISACSNLGFEFVKDQRTYQWYGRWMGDAKMPEGMTKDDLGKCNHAIKVPGARYEIGVARVGNAWELRYDYWSTGGLLKALGGEKAEKLVQAYAVQKTMNELSRAGHHYVGQQKLADGSVRIVFQGGQ